MFWPVLISALVGLVIGAGLGVLIVGVWKRKAERVRLAAQHEALIESLDVLAQAVEQEQIEISEAAIRMSHLLAQLPETVGQVANVDLSAIHQLALACDAFSRAEQRKGLTPRARHEEDKRRYQLEKDNQDVFKQAVQRLASVLPAWRSALSLSSRS